MELNNKIHGFKFTKKDEVSDIGATLYEGEHEKSGAKILYIDRKDTNKTFAIAFKTIPEDSTGVFHILEHSVLCGSDKYPVKEPFVELLKSSLKTFLNAMTYPDKTVYPVSSRNDKDFLNLVSIYMDAVLHPVAVSKPEIFYQEGWHYEVGENGELGYKGVVFNEMKGAYSSVDEVEMTEIASLLYEGSTYGLDSGGNPTVIPSLTYEEFCSAHARFYHPSNSRIILDGSVDLDKTLELLNSYLCDYDRIEINTDIPFITPSGRKEKTVTYELGAGEDETNKCRLAFGFMSAPYSDRRTLEALSVAIDAIAGSNEAPFKKAILDSGIAEDVNFIPYDGIQENSVTLELKNLKECDIPTAEALVFDTLRGIIEGGIDKKAITASLNSIEFRLREQDTATFPQGLGFALGTLDTWLYGGEPSAALAFDDDFKFLREALSGDYYESVLRTVFLESCHSAKVVMLPSKTLGEEREKNEKDRLASAKAEMTESDIEELRERERVLLEWQNTPDSKEALDTIPKLLLSDIEKEPEYHPSVGYEIDGVPAFFTPAPSRGIIYTSLLFDISDFTKEELFLAGLICDLYKNLETESYSVTELQNAIKTELGNISSAVVVGTKDGVTTPYMKVSASALASNTAKLLELLSELILKTKFTDTSAIGKIVKQLRSSVAEGISASGHAAGIARSAAQVNTEAALGEYIDGIESYLMIKAIDSDYENLSARLSDALSSVAKKIYTRVRLTAFHTGERNDEFMSALVSVFAEGEDFSHGTKIKPFGKKTEGVLIPSGVSYAALTANATDDGSPSHGSLAVARSILSYGFLWGEIRVKGGAYGAGFVRRKSGIAGFYTYRDPDAKHSVETFAKSGDFLREFAESGEDYTGFIIGAIGDSDLLVTPKVLSAMTIASFISGETYEDKKARRLEMLNTSCEDLLKCADTVDRIVECGGAVVLGGKEKLDAFGDKLDRVIEI